MLLCKPETNIKPSRKESEPLNKKKVGASEVIRDLTHHILCPT